MRTTFCGDRMLIRHMDDRDVEAVVDLALANYDGVMAKHHSAEVLAGFSHLPSRLET